MGEAEVRVACEQLTLRKGLAMDRANVEIAVAVKEAEEQQIQELNDLQLTLIGGGAGENILA